MTALLLVVGILLGHKTLSYEAHGEATQDDLQNFQNHMRMVNVSVMTSLDQEVLANTSNHVSNTSLAVLLNDQGTIDLQQRYRARKKQERLLFIQANILDRLRVTPSRQPNVTSPVFSQQERQRMAEIFERMHRTRQHQFQGNDLNRPHQVYAERFQSLYPSCYPPNNTDRYLWENTETFHLFYPITFPQPSDYIETTILASKLRIYKFNSPDPQQNNCVDCLPSSYPQFLVPSQTLTVSVSYFLKPLRMNRREKRRLVDTRNIAADLEGWLEFNVASTLQFWYENRQKNYGFNIEVTDSSGTKHNPNLFFRRMNCSDSAAVREAPFPNLLDIHPDMAENESSIFDNETYPTLDVQTAETTRQAINDNAEETSLVDAARMIKKRHAGVVFLRSTWYQACRRKQMFVSYKDLGIEEDAVENPNGGLIVGYCTGKCYKDDHRSTDQMEEKSCVALSYRPLHLKFYNQEGGLQEYTLHDVSAKDCGCAT